MCNVEGWSVKEAQGGDGGRNSWQIERNENSSENQRETNSILGKAQE